MFNRIVIIGLGLIGGSIGQALYAGQTAKEVWGFDINNESCKHAYKSRAIDHSMSTLVDGVSQAELVVLAVPVGAIRSILQELAPVLSPGTIVTDVASTKAQVVAWAEELLPTNISFVAGHPMAGKETSGIEVAEATLFQNRVYCLTPTSHTSLSAIERVSSLVQEILGARLCFLEPATHDEFVAAISHLPFLLSSALMHVIVARQGWDNASKLAAGGFRDMTRLSAGSPEMYRDICLTNRAAILDLLDTYITHLHHLREHIALEDYDTYHYFEQAKNYRLEWQSIQNK